MEPKTQAKRLGVAPMRSAGVPATIGAAEVTDPSPSEQRGEPGVKKSIYLSILVVAAVTLAVGGWIVQAARAAFRPSPRPVVEAA